VHEYGQYCPVARAAEILADRWTPLIVRELLAGIRHFNELERGLPGISRSLLVDRLRRLEDATILERHVAGHQHVEYRLTDAGQALQQIIDALGGWGAQWAFGEPRPTELDPLVLLWWMRRRVNTERLPRRRVVLQFEFRGAHRGTYWLILRPDDVSVCLQHPRFPMDLVVRADIAAFYQVWLGRLAYTTAVEQRRLSLEGAPGLVRAFPGWFAWSPMRDAVRAATVAS
jgi:DNA-binding HxlR family transcriptional regulator